MVDNLGAKSKKLIYGLAILVSSIILTVSLYGAFNPIGTSQESNILSPSSVSTDDDAIRIALPIVEEYIEDYDSMGDGREIKVYDNQGNEVEFISLFINAYSWESTWDG